MQDSVKDINTESNTKESKGKKAKRVVALIGVIVMVVLIIATFIVALMSFPGSQQVFLLLVGCDVIVPIMIWGYTLLIKAASDEDDKISN